MPKFEYEDVVKCTNNDGVPSLVIGMNYSVSSCSDDYVWLDLRAEYGTPSVFNPERFEITNEEVTYQYPICEAYPCLGDDEEYSEGSEIECKLFAAKRLLSLAASELENCHNYELAEEITTFLEI